MSTTHLHPAKNERIYTLFSSISLHDEERDKFALHEFCLSVTMVAFSLLK